MITDPLFRTLFENSLDAILIADDEGRYTDANPVACALLGEPKERIVGKRVADFIRPEDIRVTERLWESFREKQTQKGEITLRAADGSAKILEYAALADVVPGRHVSFLRDVTAAREIERQKAEALQTQLARVNEAARLKSAFIANVSHEIRTPLNALLGFNELLKTSDLSTDDRHRFHDIITRNGELLLKLIDDILDLSRIEGGQMTLEARPVSLPDLLAEISRALEAAATAKSLSFKLSVADDVPETILTDASRLRQILMNLGGNAVKFTREGSVEIKASTAQNPARIHFDVCDTGLGVSAEHRDHLFRPFMPADVSSSRKSGGAGLGLALARKIAESLGGTVALSESRPGLGSVFRLTIPGPAGVVPPAEKNEKSREPEAVRSLTDRRVLLVEDSPDNQFLIRRFLESHGAAVDVVSNGRMALDQAFVKPYDVVLMDLQMPVLDGRSATKLLRIKGFRAPIVAITAHALSSDREAALAAGCTDFLTKPIDLPLLIHTISRAISSPEA